MPTDVVIESPHGQFELLQGVGSLYSYSSKLVLACVFPPASGAFTGSSVDLDGSIDFC
jgi:hypothetical protein